MAGWPRLRFAAPAFAILLLGALVLRPGDRAGKALAPDPTPNESGSDAGIRLKGGEAGLAIYRKGRGGSELILPHALAHAGDTLQVFYHSRVAGYGIVFSLDGSGGLTLHFPESEGDAAPLQTGRMLPLPHAFRLDKAPRFERFFLITSPLPFRSDSLLAVLRARYASGQTVPDTLPGLEGSLRQYPYTIGKAAPRGVGNRKGAR